MEVYCDRSLRRRRLAALKAVSKTERGGWQDICVHDLVFICLFCDVVVIIYAISVSNASRSVKGIGSPVLAVTHRTHQLAIVKEMIDFGVENNELSWN